MPRKPKQIIEPIQDGSFEDVSKSIVKNLLDNPEICNSAKERPKHNSSTKEKKDRK